MEFSEGRGVKTPSWSDNEIVRTEDINFLRDAPYQNFTDNLAKMISGNTDGNTPDTVVTGLEIEHTTLLSATLKTGAILSFRGYYLANGQWGFNASPGDLFSVTVSEDQALGFTPGHVSDPRVDIVEIRPIEVYYDTKSRKFKDPITGEITSVLVNTKKEYGFAFQIVDGTPGPSPVAPARTEGWVKIAEVSVASGATAITQNDIKDVRNSSGWTTEPEVTTLLSGVLPIREATSIDLSKYIENVSVVVSEETPFTITFSNALQSGKSLTIVNSSNGVLTLAGTVVASLDPGDSMIVNSSGSIMTFGRVKNFGIVVTTSDYTIPGNTNEIYISTNVDVTTGSADRTITLPLVANSNRRLIRITKKDSGSGRVIIEGNGSEKIQNALRKRLYQSGEYFELLCNGTSWDIVHPIVQKRFTEPSLLENWRPTGSLGTIDGWQAIAWSPELGLFAAVSGSGSTNAVMTSPDGINWTRRTTTGSYNFTDIAWSPELDLFAAVSSTAVGNDWIITSPDGITWTTRTTPANNAWLGIAWSSELNLFAAVGSEGTGNRVMTSPDGIAWTTRTTPVDNEWTSIAWSPELGLFVAVSQTGTGNRVMTSSDGITWNTTTSASDEPWSDIVWAPEPGLFVAVASSVSSSAVMTSPDGITWTSRTTPANNQWQSVDWSSELGMFAAVAFDGTGSLLMVSQDGINWDEKTSPVRNLWRGIVWSPDLGIFAAVSSDGISDRAMISRVRVITESSEILDVTESDYIIPNGDTDLYINVTTGATDRVIYLPVALRNDRRKIRIKKKDSGNGRVIVERTGSDKVQNSVRKYLNRVNEYFELLSDGVSNWEVLNPSVQRRFVALSILSNWHIINPGVSADAHFSAFAWSPELRRVVGLQRGGVYSGNQKIIYSSDGRNLWTSATLGLDPALRWRACVWSPELSLFVAIATAAVGGVAGMTSADGITWAANNIQSMAWKDIVWSPKAGLFVAVNNGGSNPLSTSPDGVNWTFRSLPEPISYLVNAIWVPELELFVVGSEGAFSGQNSIMTSPDGINWTSRSSTGGARAYNFAWSPELELLIVPVGSLNKIAYSRNGIDWFEETVSLAFDDRIIWSSELGIFLSNNGIGEWFTSQDGFNWISSAVGATLASSEGIWIPELGKFITASRSLTSPSVYTSETIG